MEANTNSKASPQCTNNTIPVAIEFMGVDSFFLSSMFGEGCESWGLDP